MENLREQHIQFIQQSLNYLDVNSKKNIIRIIKNNGIDSFQETNIGPAISADDLNNDIILYIYNYIKKCLKN